MSANLQDIKLETVDF